MNQVTGMLAEPGDRQDPRWVAVIRTSCGFRHEPLPFLKAAVPEETARRWAETELVVEPAATLLARNEKFARLKGGSR